MTKIYRAHGIHADAKIAQPVKLPDDTTVQADVLTAIVELVPASDNDLSGSQNLKFVGAAREEALKLFEEGGLYDLTIAKHEDKPEGEAA